MSVKKRTAKKSLIVRLFVLGFATYLVGVLIAGQVEVASRRQELAALEQQVEEQRIANKEVERMLTMDEDEDYMSGIARDKLDMARPDERVFYDVSGS